MLVNSAVLVFAFCCAVFRAVLPAPWQLVLLVFLLFLYIVYCRNKTPRSLLPVSVFVAGFIYATVYASYQLSLRLPDNLHSIETELVGVVTGLPYHNGRMLRFNCKIESLRPLESLASQELGGTVRLNWYGKQVPDLKAGNKIKVVVKLKPPSGFMNPGGFDREGWLLQKKIIATGYVRSKSFDVDQSVLSTELTPVASLRNKIQRNLLLASDGSDTEGLVLALAVGDRSGVSRDQWDTFISTGTNHLLAISGLHISLVAGFVALVVSTLWGLTGLVSRSTRQNSAIVAALLAATCYAAMAGFTVPTVRALIMFAVLACLTLTRRHQNRLQSLAIALIVVCLFDPLTVLTPGFWMSFAAVAVLYLVFSNVEQVGRVSTIFRVLRGHLLITIGLYPLTLLFFQQASLVSPVANLIVTPLVGLLVTPLVFVSALLALISIPLAALLLTVVGILLDVTHILLAFFASLPWALVKVSGISKLAVIVFFIGAVVMLVPVPMSWRFLCVILPLPILFPNKVSTLVEGDYRVVFLDVGQGTSVVVYTAKHVLVYDTGDQFNEEFSAADAVVVPYLRSVNVKTIDKLIVSHADRDHSGGADELLDAFSVSELLLTSPLPQRPNAESVDCVAGQSWMWDQVKFSILYPFPTSGGTANDRSCVLQISTPDGLRTLLVGDIESYAERQLVQQYQRQKTQLLLAPHHGSTTSSSDDFIQHFQPHTVVYTAGFKNRFGFPKSSVVERYAAAGVSQLNTADTGAIDILVSDGSPGIHVAQYRTTHKRWWHRETQDLRSVIPAME